MEKKKKPTTNNVPETKSESSTVNHRCIGDKGYCKEIQATNELRNEYLHIIKTPSQFSPSFVIYSYHKTILFFIHSYFLYFHIVLCILSSHKFIYTRP